MPCTIAPSIKQAHILSNLVCLFSPLQATDFSQDLPIIAVAGGPRPDSRESIITVWMPALESLCRPEDGNRAGAACRVKTLLLARSRRNALQSSQAVK